MLSHEGIGRESERVELKGESLRKVLTLPTILKINNGLNGYAPEYVEVCCHLNYLASFGSSIATLNLTEHGCVYFQVCSYLTLQYSLFDS